jgi:glycosyltransferase involved in cell wall biosynthesis
MRIVIVRAALETVSPRGPKTAQVLSSHGHNVVLLGWDRECKYPKVSREEHYEARRIRFRAPFGPKVLAFLPIWWLFEFLWLIRHKWDIVQAIDLDTVMPALIAAKMKRKKVIYEIADIYYELTRLPAWLTKTCMQIDKLFLRFADGVILANEGIVKELNGIPNANLIVVYNSPPELSRQIAATAQRSEEFIVFYSGTLQSGRRLNLDKIVRAVRGIDGIKLIIAGYGDLARQITRWANESKDKVQFVGRIDYNEVLEKTMTAGLLIALYDPVLPINRLASPNKLFEAMMCGKPIIVNKDTVMANIVEKENCGLVVDGNNVEEIKKVIVKLKEDAELRRILGANGRKAYEQRYSWQVMEQRLLSLYSSIGVD